MFETGRFLVLIGLAIAAVGLVFMAAARLPLGRLPGDVVITGKGFAIVLPIATSILLSLGLTLLANLLLRR